MSTLNYQITELNNGIRIVTETVTHVQSMAMGVWVGVGSRYETEAENGITHFIEHMLFKGTKRRSAQDIAREIDAIGGQINAFTSKEYTCYYVKALSEDFALSADILADMIFNSQFDEQELAKEREVIIEEIKMYEDTPDELANDLFALDMWGNNSLGRTILGVEETLAGFTQERLKDYMKRYYTGINMVVSVVGNITHEEVIRILTPLFIQVPRGEKNRFAPYQQEPPAIHCHQKAIGQAQIAIGVLGVDNTSDELYPISLLNTYLGGGLSSRLVQKIREEMGLAYTVYSYHGAYSDCGAFIFSAATRAENCQTVVNLIIDEARQVAQEGINDNELKRVFNQMKGSLFMGLESINSRMNKLGRSLLIQNEIITPEETVEKLWQVTPEMIQQTAKKLFAEGRFCVTVLGQVENITIKPIE